MPPEKENQFDIKLMLSEAEDGVISKLVTEFQRTTTMLEKLSKGIEEQIKAFNIGTTQGGVRSSSRPYDPSSGSQFLIDGDGVAHRVSDTRPRPDFIPPPESVLNAGGGSPPSGDTTEQDGRRGGGGNNDAYRVENVGDFDRRMRGAIVGGTRGRYSRQVPPIGHVTAQQALTYISDAAGQKGWHTYTDENGYTRLGRETFDEETGETTTEHGMIEREGRAAGLARGLSGFAGRLSGSMLPGFVAVGGGIALAKGTQEILGALAAPGKAGMSMGYERSFTGAGARNYLGGVRDAALESAFGFNPYMGFGTAMEINNKISSLGYRGDERSSIFGATSGIAEHTGLDWKSALDFLDSSGYRTGVTSLQDFVSTMETIPASAQAARMNVKDFQQQLQQVSEQLADQLGQPAMRVAGQVSAASLGTGMSPGAIGSLTGNTLMTILEAQRHGQTPGQWFRNPDRSVFQSTEGPDTLFRMVFGKPLTALRTDLDLQDKVSTMYAFGQGQQLFGMRWDQLLHLANDQGQGGALDRGLAGGDFNNLNLLKSKNGGPDLVSSPNKLYHLGDLTERDSLNQRIVGDLHKAGVSQDLIDKLRADSSFTSTDYDGVRKELNKARALIQQQTNQKTAAANVNVHAQISLQGYAKNILQATISQADLDSVNSAPKSGRHWYDAIPAVASYSGIDAYHDVSGAIFG